MNPYQNPTQLQTWLSNVREARRMWNTIPPENVYTNLEGWNADNNDNAPTCKTIACFGGWCAWWPAFQKQGVKVGICGSPFITDGANHISSPSHVASYKLFGDYGMFSARLHNESPLSDKMIVYCRLESQENFLLAKLRELANRENSL